MNRTWTWWLAWALLGCAVVMLLLSWLFALAAGVTPEFDIASSLVLVVLPLVGALVASRHPQNVIGWLFLGSGLMLALSGSSYGYAALALQADPALPGGVAAAWLTSWVFLPAMFGVPPLLFLLFPDGRPASRRWALVVGLTVLCVASAAVGAAVSPGNLSDSPVPGVENPVGASDAVAAFLVNVGWMGGSACIVLATISLVQRFRQSRGEQRLQMRLFTLAAVAFLAALFVSEALYLTPLAEVWSRLIVLIGFSTLPLAAGAAILRYRLYDIDVVIKRTVVYSTLTVALLATYVVLVLVLRVLLQPVAGRSDLAVAASTLAVAALFRPLRSAVQEGVDRRFFRSRYDAARTLEGFTGRLRHELDLEQLGTDLRVVVLDTMQPDHVSLWLRTPGSTT